VKELHFSLDFRSGMPIYEQIVEQVQTFLANGDLKPGDQLPTVRQLASELRINFNTIARAYRMLDEAGLISTQQGRGTYLLEQPSETSMQLIKQESLEYQIKKFLRSLENQGFSAEESQPLILSLAQSWRDGKLEKDIEHEKQK
jgi:GntR family transcriptional regulator